ncbi:MAG: AAA family ATPase, partial [Tannerellaceae bacterium]
MNSNLKQLANSYAEEYRNATICPAHLFKALLHKDVGLVHFLEKDLDKDYYYLQEWADIQMLLLPKVVRPVHDLNYSPEALAVLEEADNYQLKLNVAECEPICVLLALATPGVGFTFEQLKTLPLNVSEICTKIGASPSMADPSASEGAQGGYAAVEGKDEIAKYCVDKIREAKSTSNSPVIGFEGEISTIYEILGRKAKSNLLIMGEAGVGKTALLNGFVAKLVNGHVPAFLQKASVYELDLAALAADSSYKGEVENRFKKILQQVKNQENCILIIESVHKLFDKQSSVYGSSSILKQELSKGNLLLLCTATIDGYTKNIETDKEFVTKLDKITVEEPNADLCLRILQGAISPYEAYHGLTVSEAVMADAIRLAKRYLTEKSLPDSAFDLIDRTMSLVKTMNDMSTGDLSSLKEKLDSIVLEMQEQAQDEVATMKKLDWLNYEMMNKVSCILLAQIDTDTDFAKIATVTER